MSFAGGRIVLSNLRAATSSKPIQLALHVTAVGTGGTPQAGSAVIEGDESPSLPTLALGRRLAMQARGASGLTSNATVGRFEQHGCSHLEGLGDATEGQNVNVYARF